MLRVSALLLVAVWAVGITALATHHLAVPFISWSSRSDAAQHVQVQAVKTSYEVMYNLERRLTAQRPEAVIAFIHPQMSSDEFSQLPDDQMQLLQNTIESAPFSEVLPFVYTQSCMHEQLTRVVQSNQNYGQIITLDEKDATCESFQATLASSSSFFRDQLTDFIVVPWNAVNATCVQSLVAQLSQLTNDNYVGIITADKATTVDSFFSTGDRSAMSLFELQASTARASATPRNPRILLKGVQFISPGILYGIFFGLLFLLMLYCGVSCLNTVQTPLRYSAVKMTVSKEY